MVPASSPVCLRSTRTACPLIVPTLNIIQLSTLSSVWSDESHHCFLRFASMVFRDFEHLFSHLNCILSALTLIICQCSY